MPTRPHADRRDRHRRRGRSTARALAFALGTGRADVDAFGPVTGLDRSAF